MCIRTYMKRGPLYINIRAFVIVMLCLYITPRAHSRGPYGAIWATCRGRAEYEAHHVRQPMRPQSYRTTHLSRATRIASSVKPIVGPRVTLISSSFSFFLSFFLSSGLLSSHYVTDQLTSPHSLPFRQSIGYKDARSDGIGGSLPHYTNAICRRGNTKSPPNSIGLFFVERVIWTRLPLLLRIVTRYTRPSG